MDYLQSQLPQDYYEYSLVVVITFRLWKVQQDDYAVAMAESLCCSIFSVAGSNKHAWPIHYGECYEIKLFLISTSIFSPHRLKVIKTNGIVAGLGETPRPVAEFLKMSTNNESGKKLYKQQISKSCKSPNQVNQDSDKIAQPTTLRHTIFFREIEYLI